MSEENEVPPPAQIEDYMAQIYQRREEARERAIAALKAAIGPLGKLGLARVIWEYDGSGDSGDIEQVSYIVYDPDSTDLRGVTSGPFDKLNERALTSADFKAAVKERLTPEEAALIENNVLDESVYCLLPPGFEINEGSYGEVDLDVVTGAIQVRNNERVMETLYSEHDY